MAHRIVIVIPAFNEQETLVEKLSCLIRYRNEHFPESDIIIADNNSTDDTPVLAKQLASRESRVIYHFVGRKGKGAAIKETWLSYDYDIYAFMDEDLSAELNAFGELVRAIGEGYDIAIGSRYVQGACPTRTFKREVVSKGYRILFGLLFNLGISDCQCGFKAINRAVRDNVLPQVEEDGFSFDSELLVRAFSLGYTIKEVPIQWIEDSHSTVNMKREIPLFLKKLARLKYKQLTGQLRQK